MKIPRFEERRPLLEDQYIHPNRIEESGVSEEELKTLMSQIETDTPSKAIAKAKTFEMLVKKAPIAIDPDDLFQEKILAYGLMEAQRNRWRTAVEYSLLSEQKQRVKRAWGDFGSYDAHCDFGHTSPNSRLLLSVGFSGLLERVTAASQRDGLTERQKEFYLSCQIALRACITAARRLADAIEPYNGDCARALRAIADGAPKTLYEAMQLLILYFFLHEYVGATRVRTLGRLDVLLFPFYQSDLEKGLLTKEDALEMLKFFLHKFWIAKVPYDLPFCLGGMDENGSDVTNEMSYMIVNAYDALNIYSPKIHIRVSDGTPTDFVLRILDCIRHGNSSFVFINDRIGIEALTRIGITEREARDFVPIGCYEPAVWGVEIGCTGNGGVNLPKAIEAVFNGGKDLKSGALCGIPTEMPPASYEEFLDAVKANIAYMTEEASNYIVTLERHYGEIGPDPLLSCQYEHSVEQGVDVYEGGAKYNNSSLYFYSIASLVDSVCAVKRLVFDEKKFTFEQLGEILRADWVGFEKERLSVLRLPEKYGNGNLSADDLTRELSDFCAALLNGKPNGRGGVFKPAIFTIDHCFHTGKRTMATPDGRRAGEPLSKNLSATVGMDRHGITALINSATVIDQAAFSTGSVLDVMLHPSAVAGEDGLLAFYHVLMTYFKKKGFAMHGNVFDASVLKKAQAAPEQYKNLQVRVCGWNAYFVNLKKVEQDCFIRQAEGLL